MPNHSSRSQAEAQVSPTTRTILIPWISGMATLIGLVMVSLVSGLGLVIAGSIVMLPAILIVVTRPDRAKARRILVTGIIFGLIVLLVDIFWPGIRKPISGSIQTLVPFIVIGEIIVFGMLTLNLLQHFSVQVKIIITSLIVSIIPLGILGYISNQATREALVNAANGSLVGAAVQTADNLDDFLRTNLDTVRTEAQLPDFGAFLATPQQPSTSGDETSNAAEVTNTLLALNRRDQLYITSYGLLNRSGIDLVDTYSSNIGSDLSDRDYFQTPVTTGLPFVSAVEIPQTTGQPSIYFSAPVRDAQGDVVGVLRIRYNGIILQQLITNAGGLAGPQSYAVLLDENHMRLADGSTSDLDFMTVMPLDPARITALVAAHRILKRPADQLSTNLPDFERGLDNAASQPFFQTVIQPANASVMAVAVASVKEEPWQIAFAQSENVFLAPVDAQTRDAILLIFVISVVVAAAAASVAQRLTSPIVRLTAVAEKVGAGDLNVQAVVEADDEIGKLAATFNLMAIQLRQTLDGLADRSKELKDVNQQLLHELDERQRAGVALRESEERYMLAAKGVNDGLWDWNLASDTVYYSERWKSMLGYSGEEIGTAPREWFDRVHPEDLLLLQNQLSAHLKEHTEHFDCEYRICLQDGQYRWMRARGVAVWNADAVALRIAGSQTDITLRKQNEERLIRDAMHDALTGLPNRVLFIDRLYQALERTKRHPEHLSAILFVDLDRFKMINDSLGHQVGDQMLIAVARRLQACLRPEDTVARLGGDEFAILLDEVNDISATIRVADRIQKQLKSSTPILNNLVQSTSASIGIAPITQEYEKVEDILRDADTAMYRAKALGRAQHQIFEADMHTLAVALLALEDDLRRAIQSQEWLVYYQPIVSLITGQVSGIEALVRWQHPTRGIVSPLEFIPIAEETGLILPIGEYVLRAACAQVREWRNQGHPNLWVSVNVSARQFQDQNLVKMIENTLAQTGLPPEGLRVELTESVAMNDLAYSVNILNQLMAIGIHVSIDDFGIGYSSLSYLQRFPIQSLKIDRSFIQDLSNNEDSMAITAAIIAMAHSLKLKVVAEGVETNDQAAVLIALGCDEIQGYMISRPVPPLELTNSQSHWWYNSL